MYSKSDKIEIMISDETAEIIEKPFNPIKNRYQNNLHSMRGSEFVFDYVISSKDDNDEEHVMYSKSDNIEILVSDETDEIIKTSLIHLKTDVKIIYI